MVQGSGILTSSIVDQFGGITAANEVLQFTGAAQDTHIVNPSQFATTAGTKFIIFPKTFSRGNFISGIMGTSGTVASFFDRSPFFFTPSETDPNTLRDISEAEQFLIFSEASIVSFDPFRNNPKSTVVIADRGEGGTGTTEIITNGSFEQSFSGWTVSGTGGGSTITTVTSQPAGVGFDDGSPVSPTDGDSMAYIKARAPAPSLFLSQEFNFGTRRANSSQLGTLSFSLCPDGVGGNRYFQVSVLFFLGDTQQANLRYRVSGMANPTEPPETL